MNKIKIVYQIIALAVKEVCDFCSVLEINSLDAGAILPVYLGEQGLRFCPNEALENTY